MRRFSHLESCDVAQPPGAVFCMDRQEYLALGGLDEQLYLFYNDVDLCKQLWNTGRKIRYLADAEVMHHEGASTSSHGGLLVTWYQNRIAYYRKHYGAWVMPWMRLTTWLRAVEEHLRFSRRYPDKEMCAAARRELWHSYREVWSRPVGYTPVEPRPAGGVAG